MKVFKILSTLLIVSLFSQCGITKFKKNPPFLITSTIKKSVLDEYNNVKGTNIIITYTSSTNIEFDSLYYSNRIVKPHKDKLNNSKQITGFIPTYKKSDLILDNNSTKEFNNSFPEIKKFPFKLSENEVVISYKINDKIKFYKFKISS